jgi:hypothetical protein
MMIFESKEELARELQRIWNTLLRVDVSLEDAATTMEKIHKDVRAVIRNNENTPTVHRRDVDSPQWVGARSKSEAKRVLGLSDALSEQPLYTGRDTSK